MRLLGFDDPASQASLGGANTAVELARAVVQRHQGGASSKSIGLVAAPGSVCAVGRFDFQATLGGLLEDDLRHGLGVVAVEPRKGRVALYRGDRCGLFGA